MFGKGRAHRKLANKIGQQIHRQLIQAFEERPQLFENASEMVFTAAYLKAFTFIAFSGIGCRDLDVHLRQIQYFCNGALPNRLWDIFQRGEALYELSEGEEREEFRQARESFELGQKAGIFDGCGFTDSGRPPSNFTNFLTRGTIEVPGL